MQASIDNEEKILYELQAQWAHRYGVSSLPGNNELGFSNNYDEDFEKAHDFSEKEVDLGNENKDQKQEIKPIQEFSSSQVEGKSTFDGLRSVFTNYIDEINSAFKDNDKKKADLQELSTGPLFDSEFEKPTPPPRKLSHLSKWLTSVDEEVPKAS